MHRHDPLIAHLADRALEYSLDRIRMDPVPLDAPKPSQLDLKCLDRRGATPFFTSLAGPPP